MTGARLWVLGLGVAMVVAYPVAFLAGAVTGGDLAYALALLGMADGSGGHPTAVGMAFGCVAVVGTGLAVGVWVRPRRTAR
jgi:hypothetical protein